MSRNPAPHRDATPFVRVVVLNWNAADLTARCVRSVLATRHPPGRLEVVVLDNGSVDDSLELLRREFPVVRIVENGANLGFAEGCNRALRDLDGVDFVALVNNDAVVDPGWLVPLLDVMADPDVGAACPKILLEARFVDVALPAGTTVADVERVFVLGVDVIDRVVRFRGDPQRLGVPVEAAVEVVEVVEVTIGSDTIELRPTGGPSTRINSVGLGFTEYLEGLELGHGEPDTGADAPREVLGFSGGGVLLRPAALAEVGLFDPRFFAYYEDVDLGWRLRRAGWRIVCAPASVTHHLLHGSGGPRRDFFFVANTRNWLLTALRNGTPAQVAAAYRYGLARAWFAIRRDRSRATATTWLRIWTAVVLSAPRILASRWGGRPVGAVATGQVTGPLLRPPSPRSLDVGDRAAGGTVRRSEP